MDRLNAASWELFLVQQLCILVYTLFSPFGDEVDLSQTKFAIMEPSVSQDSLTNPNLLQISVQPTWPCLQNRVCESGSACCILQAVPAGGGLPVSGLDKCSSHIKTPRRSSLQTYKPNAKPLIRVQFQAVLSVTAVTRRAGDICIRNVNTNSVVIERQALLKQRCHVQIAGCKIKMY